MYTYKYAYNDTRTLARTHTHTHIHTHTHTHSHFLGCDYAAKDCTQTLNCIPNKKTILLGAGRWLAPLKKDSLHKESNI